MNTEPKTAGRVSIFSTAMVIAASMILAGCDSSDIEIPDDPKPPVTERPQPVDVPAGQLNRE